MIEMRVVPKPTTLPRTRAYDTSIYTYPFMEECLDAINGCDADFLTRYFFKITRNDVTVNFDALSEYHHD